MPKNFAQFAWLASACVACGTGESAKPRGVDDARVERGDTSSFSPDLGRPAADGAITDLALAAPVLDAAQSVPDVLHRADAALPVADAAAQAADAASDALAADASACEAPCATPSLASVDRPLDTAAWRRDVARTRDNPLRGFMTSYLWGAPRNDFPDRLEYFYVPMSAVWGAEGPTLDSGLEVHLAAAAARGHHAVVRVYIDYPGVASGLPPHLVDEVPCRVYDEYGGGCSPDYDDPQLVEAMLGLVEALGARYDADPRLGFLQVGLLGFWGEWHTWPHPDFFPSQATQRAVLSAFDEAFTTTQLQVRLPHANALDLRMGFHDDSFAYSTLGDVGWFFVPVLEGAGAGRRWREVAIGGELRPELQGSIFEADYAVGDFAQDFGACVQATHATYLLNYGAYNEGGTGYSGEERARAEAAALSLGYQFELTGASLQATGLLGDTVQLVVLVSLSQTGVAPFYYPLALQLDADGLASPAFSAEDLQTLLPGESRTLTFDLGRVSTALLNQPMRLSFVSRMLLDGQQIALATSTPWDPTPTSTAVQWALGCDDGSGGALAVGQVSGRTPGGCDCRCDVDGVVRACGEALCAEFSPSQE
jgi:hypothetical protein